MRLEVDGDTIYLKSLTFEALTWPDDVIAAARRMVPSIKAAIRLAGVTGPRAVDAYRVVVQTPEGPRDFVYVYRAGCGRRRRGSVGDRPRRVAATARPDPD